MTGVAYGVAMPSVRGVLTTLSPGLPLDLASDVTVTGAWSVQRALLTSFGSGSRFRVRDTSNNNEQDCVTPAEAGTFLGGHAGAIVDVYDQSGAGNAFMQATASRQPAFTANAASTGKAAAALDNSNDYMATAANMSTMFSTSSWYMAVVCYFNALAGTSTAVWNNQTVLGNASGYIYTAVMADGTFEIGNYSHFDTKTAPGAVSAIVPVLLECRRKSGNDGVRVNGGSWVEHSDADPTSIAQPLVLGKTYSSAQPFNGYFFEGYVADAEPAAVDSIAASLMAYYGIA